MADPKPLPAPKGGPLGLLTLGTYQKLRNALMRKILPDPDDFEIVRSEKFLKFRLRPIEAADNTHPFQVVDASNEEDGVRVYVRPGFIQSTIGWAGPFSGSLLDDSDPLDKFYLEVAASGFVVLKSEIQEDANRVPTMDDITVIYATSVPANTATAAHLVVAVVTFADGAITHVFQNIKSNLLHSVEFEPYSVPDYWRQLIGPASPSDL